MSRTRSPCAAVLVLFLLCSHEAHAVRQTVELSVGMQQLAASAGVYEDSVHPGSTERRAEDEGDEVARPASAGDDAQEQAEPDALGRIERLFDKVGDQIRAWQVSRQATEDAADGEASLAELRAHLDRTVLGAGHLDGLDRRSLEAAEAELRRHAKNVENINLFVCKRTPVVGYRDTGFFVEERVLENAHFQVRCSNKVNILNQGKVGDALGDADQKHLVAAIDQLKSSTQSGTDGENFPIQLKLCTRKEGCERREANSVVDSESQIFAGGLMEAISVPEHLKEFLPKVKHNDDHLYAVCFDDQDDCDGMMWVPRNLHGCNGWFTAKDARVTLSQLRDALDAGIWSRYWTPEGKERIMGSLSGGDKRLLAAEASEGESEKDAEVLSDVSTKVEKKRCAVREWQQKEALRSEQDLREVQDAVVQALRAGQTATAQSICRDSQEAGEGVNCGTKASGEDAACRALAQQCQRVGVAMQAAPCRSRAELETLASSAASGDAVQVRSRDSSFSRRRRGQAAEGVMDLFFPRYYYGYSPFCYTWYGGPGGLYGYPVMPLYSGGMGFGYGFTSPGFLLLDGMGHLAYGMGQGMFYVGGHIASGLGLSGGSSSSGSGDAGLVIALILLLIVVLTAIVSYCSDEDNCHSWWYRGGRLRKKQRTWNGLWEGLEAHIYGAGGHLLFDGRTDMSSRDRCVKTLQWGRKWIQKSDVAWEKKGVSGLPAPPAR